MDNTKEAQDAKEEGIPDRIFIGNSYEKNFEQKGKHYPWKFIRADLVPQWIKCSERMPELSSNLYDVAVTLENGTRHVTVGMCNGNEFYLPGGLSYATYKRIVTHWRERPQYPTEEV